VVPTIHWASALEESEMSTVTERPAAAGRKGLVRGPQALLGGLALLALAGLALWLTRDLPQGTLRSMGPAMLPRWLAIGVGLCGLALVVLGFARIGESLERWSLRGPFFVILSILAFAVTIRPFQMGPIGLPGLGLIAAGPLAIVIGGYATHEVRLRDLVIMALTLTPFCMVLFGDLLNLPIPIFPLSLAELFPADWSQKQILRVTAVTMALAGLAVYLATRAGHRGKPTKIDIADHSGNI
jgi:hypothetical protein